MYYLPLLIYRVYNLLTAYTQTAFLQRSQYFLPPVMHPESVSGMGIAKNCPIGNESFLSSNDTAQFLLAQVIK